MSTDEEKKLKEWDAMGRPEVWHREVVHKTPTEFVFVDVDQGYGRLRITVVTDETVKVDKAHNTVVCKNYLALGDYWGFGGVVLYKSIKKGEKR